MREEELSVLPFWEKLKKNQKELLCKGTKQFSVSKGERVVSADNEYGVFFIKKGSFSVLLMGETDIETELFRLKREDYAILDHNVFYGQEIADIAYQALTASDVIMIEKEAFSYFLKNNYFFTESVVKSTLSLFPALISAIRQRDYYNLDKRIISVLLGESARQRSNTLLITHGQIASKIGSAREVVTRKLHEFSEAGIISCSRGKVVLINKDKIRKWQTSL